jgi:hypothetical protein
MLDEGWLTTLWQGGMVAEARWVTSSTGPGMRDGNRRLGHCNKWHQSWVNRPLVVPSVSRQPSAVSRQPVSQLVEPRQPYLGSRQPWLAASVGGDERPRVCGNGSARRIRVPRRGAKEVGVLHLRVPNFWSPNPDMPARIVRVLVACQAA